MLRIHILLISISVLASSCFWQNQDENKVIEHKKIIALWDSLTAWYGVETADSYPSQLEKKLLEDGYDIEIINAGVSGDTSGDLLARAGEYLASQPDIAILVIWGNDGLRGNSVIDMKENIQEIIMLYESQNIEIVLGWMDILPTHGFGYRSDFKSVYKELAKENSQLHFFKKIRWPIRRSVN